MRSVRPGIVIAALFLTGACVDEVRMPTDVPPVRSSLPSDDQFELARSQAVQLEEWAETISPSSCEGSAFTWLDLGSAWLVAASSEDGWCLVWLGGETENPGYDGRPTQFCKFAVVELPVTVLLGQGGPARIDHPNCVDLPQA